MEIYLLLFFILILSIFLGLELISKIPSTLHTPLMSGANAISGITLVGALTLDTGSNLQSRGLVKFTGLVLKGKFTRDSLKIHWKIHRK